MVVNGPKGWSAKRRTSLVSVDGRRRGGARWRSAEEGLPCWTAKRGELREWDAQHGSFYGGLQFLLQVREELRSFVA